MLSKLDAPEETLTPMSNFYTINVKIETLYSPLEMGIISLEASYRLKKFNLMYLLRQCHLLCCNPCHQDIHLLMY